MEVSACTSVNTSTVEVGLIRIAVRSHPGSSDAPAASGCGPYATPRAEVAHYQLAKANGGELGV